MLEQNDEIFTLAQAADYAHVERQAIFVAIRDGKLIAEKRPKGGLLCWFVKRSDLDAYRASKYIRDKRIVDGQKLFDIENGRLSVFHLSKLLTKKLKRPYPTARIYHLLYTGALRASKKANAWVISAEDAEKLYLKEKAEREAESGLDLLA
jgi:hypothetical protein